jgi:site-specific DNA recombinase
VRVVSVEEMYDSKVSDPTFFQIYAVLAESESRKTSIRVSLGNKEKARKGLWVTATTPLGYVRVNQLQDDQLKQELYASGIHPHQLHPHPQESIIVKRIFSLFVGGRIGKRNVADKLNEVGSTTRNGYRWSDRDIHRVLINEVHIGTVIYGKKKRHVVELKGGTTVKRDIEVDADKVIITENAHPRNVSIEDFYEAQRIISERRPINVNGANFNNAKHPLVGILKCGTCGSGVICQTRRIKLASGDIKTYRYYVCSAVQRGGRAACSQKNIPAGEIEDYIYKTIKDKILAIDIDSMLDKYATFDPNREINKQISDIDKRISSLEDKTLAIL